VHFVFLFFKTGSCCVAQAGLELLGSSYPLASASQVAGTAGMPQCLALSLGDFFHCLLTEVWCSSEDPLGFWLYKQREEESPVGPVGVPQG
jgi:hypothetical protein